MKYLIFILTVMFVSSCTTVTDVNLPLPEPFKKLGLYCIFTPDSIWKVNVFRLGAMSEYEENNPDLWINGATVLLDSDKFQTDTLVNTGNGEYKSKTTTRPQFGVSYKLRVSFADYPALETDTASLPVKFHIDSIKFFNELQLGIIESDFNGENEDMQLSFWFANPKNTPILINFEHKMPIWETQTSRQSFDFFYLTLKPKFQQSYSELSFVLFNNNEQLNAPEQPNTMIISYVSEAFFQFDKGAKLQNESRDSRLNFLPGNVFSNVKNGFGIFTGINPCVIYLDSIPVLKTN